MFPIKLTKAQYHARSKKSWVTRKAKGISAMPKHMVDGKFKLSKRGKYNARGCWVGTQWCASGAEAARYVQLMEMQAMGMIGELECQPKFPCYVNGHLVTTYIADFRYRTRPRQLGSRLIVEEVKGVVTDAYRIKRALVHALHLTEIMEIPVADGIDRCRMLTADQLGRAAEKEEAWPRMKSTGSQRSSSASQD